MVLVDVLEMILLVLAPLGLTKQLYLVLVIHAALTVRLVTQVLSVLYVNQTLILMDWVVVFNNARQEHINKCQQYLTNA